VLKADNRLIMYLKLQTLSLRSTSSHLRSKQQKRRDQEAKSWVDTSGHAVVSILQYVTGVTFAEGLKDLKEKRIGGDLAFEP
jgi:hypothetical protein